MLKRTRRSSERVHAVKKRKSRKKLNEEKIENITLLAGLIDKYDINYRKRKLTTYQAVETMMYMNKSAISYDEATSIVLRNIVDSSTLRKRIQAWMNMDIPKLVWEEITREYMEQRFKENKKFFKNVFIDATMIKNDLGVDCIGPNPTDRGRPGTKLSALTTCDKVIYSSKSVLGQLHYLGILKILGCQLAIVPKHDEKQCIWDFLRVDCYPSPPRFTHIQKAANQNFEKQSINSSSTAEKYDISK